MAYEQDRITGNAQEYRRVPETRSSGSGLLVGVLLAVVVGAGIYAFSSMDDNAVAPDNTTIINEPAAPAAPAVDPAVPATPDAPAASTDAPAADAVEPAAPAPAPAAPAAPAPAP